MPELNIIAGFKNPIIKNCRKTAVFFIVILCLRLSVAGQTLGDSVPSLYSIHQEVDFKESPQRLYQALLDSREFSDISALSGKFSSQSARIDATVGGAFSLFDGHIIGRNLELVSGQRIVQAWRVVDWPAGLYSIMKVELRPKGSGTRLVFDHTGFPENLHDHLAEGWQLHYWQPLAMYLRH